MCTDPNYDIIAHIYELADEFNLGSFSNFIGMSCFEISHTPAAENPYTTIHRRGKKKTFL